LNSVGHSDVYNKFKTLTLKHAVTTEMYMYYNIQVSLFYIEKGRCSSDLLT